MTNFRMLMIASLLGLSTGVAFGQTGTSDETRAGPDKMGSGPAAGAPGRGVGMRPGGGHGATRWGSDFTPGWALMTPQERNEHRDHMRTMKSYDECKIYQDQHHEKMVERAKERGGKSLPHPRRDACAGLKK